jgi:hypothetical protein
MMTLQTYIMMYTPQRYPLTMKICCMNQNSIINFFFYQRLHREKDGELYFGR